MVDSHCPRVPPGSGFSFLSTCADCLEWGEQGRGTGTGEEACETGWAIGRLDGGQMGDRDYFK